MGSGGGGAVIFGGDVLAQRINRGLLLSYSCDQIMYKSVKF